MAFTYKWEVTGLRKRDQVNSNGETLPGAIVQTYWKVTGTDADGNEASFSGATPFTAVEVPAGEFVAFENLTEETVLSWIRASVEGPAGYMDHINERIQNEIDKTAETDAALPWAPDVTPDMPRVDATPEVSQDSGEANTTPEGE